MEGRAVPNTGQVQKQPEKETALFLAESTREGDSKPPDSVLAGNLKNLEKLYPNQQRRDFRTNHHRHGSRARKTTSPRFYDYYPPKQTFSAYEHCCLCSQALTRAHNCFSVLSETSYSKKLPGSLEVIPRLRSRSTLTRASSR
jgi:hypothetical protein